MCVFGLFLSSFDGFDDVVGEGCDLVEPRLEFFRGIGLVLGLCDTCHSENIYFLMHRPTTKPFLINPNNHAIVILSIYSSICIDFFFQ